MTIVVYCKNGNVEVFRKIRNFRLLEDRLSIWQDSSADGWHEGYLPREEISYFEVVL